MYSHFLRKDDEAPIWLPNGNWACCRHIPAAQLPPSAEDCFYYGCTVKRPPKQVKFRPKPVLPPEPTPIPENETLEDLTRRRQIESDNAIIARALREYEEQGSPFLASTPAKPAPIKGKGAPWKDWGNLDEAALWTKKIRNLRKYARHTLGIIGASKIRGGKAVLIPLILQTREDL